MRKVLLISTYDLGRQPFGLASAAAALHAAGALPVCVDLSRDKLSDAAILDADVVAFFLPMHTATRLALPVIDRVRALNSGATLCAYGLYAPLNAAILRERGVTAIIGGEFEDDLVAAGLKACATGGETGVAQAFRPAATVPRVQFRIPLRDSLPPPERYASLQWGDERRVVGYTEGSRGCKHRCRHCPIVPVYDGRFRIVPADLVLADVRQQVAAGVRHLTFGDPDFFNGPRHAVDVVRRLAAEFHDLSYDVTIKVEHLIDHADLLPVLQATGCAFVTSAVESVDDEVLLKLEKGHTAAGFERAAELCRGAGLVMAPTFVPFTPWTTAEGFCTLLETIDRLRLVDHVAPIQLAIRLLVPEGSRLLELEEIRALVKPFDGRSLTHPWVHPDPAVDALQQSVSSLVGRRLNASRREMFEEIWSLAHAAVGRTPAPRLDPGILPRAAVPYLNEPWYC
jgi:radical SAM superfamily enzyme YgiQ (UPF0313 family)